MDIKYAFYNTSKGYKVVGGTAAHFLKADGSLDGTEYIDKYSEQNIFGRKSFLGATGNSYNLVAIETRGNGSAIFPSIGFHQPGQFAGIISLRNSNQFYFKNADDSDFNYLFAKGYVKSGSDDSYILLGGGGHIPISSFTSSGYLDYIDDREVSPSKIEPMKFGYGFTSWDQNNNAPWADFLHLGGYPDASGGNQNLILFKKNGFGLRQYQSGWQDSNKYTKYVEYWNSSHFSNNDINNWNNLVAASGNYVTLNTEQLILARKAIQGATGNRYDQSAIETRGNGSTIYPSIGFHQPGSHAGTISLRDSNQFYFRNTDDSDFNYLLAKGFAKYGSDDDHFLTGSGGHYPKSGKDDAYIHSGRDFAQGTRILTNIDYSQAQGGAFLLEIKGNMYGGGMVMDCKVQGYIYNGTIINQVGYSTHPLLTEIIALNLNGELCFWFPRLSYWQGFSVKVVDVTSGGVTTTTNRAYQIADTADPGGTKRVSIPIATIATQNWVNDKSFATTNTVQAITALKEFYATLAIANGQSIYLKGSSDTAHYIKHFSDDTDGFGVSSGFAVKDYSTIENLFKVTIAGFGEFKQNVRAGGFLKAGSSNNFVLLGYGDHKPLSDFWTSANFNPAAKVNAWENAYAVGFSSGLSTGAPYIYHTTDGYVFLATQSWVLANFGSQSGIKLNEEFTTNTGSGLVISDDDFGGESGILDRQLKRLLAAKKDGYYFYGSEYGGFSGLNFHCKSGLFGMGRVANKADKLTVEGSVKASRNFKSEEERPDTIFIPNGETAGLRDEIINDESEYSIRLDPHEYVIDSSSYFVINDRNRLIHVIGDYVKMLVNFKEVYPKQQIVIYNFDSKYSMEVQIQGKTIYYIDPNCFIRLYVPQSLRVIAERQQPCNVVW